MITRINLTAALLSFVFLGAGCDLYGPTVATEFQATLTGGAERPDPVETDAMGTGTFSLNADETQLSYSISASGFSEDVIAAHFHFSADGADGSGGIVFGITDSVVNDGNGGVTAEGTWDLTAEDVLNLRLDYIYVNLHTEANPAGEIRGNLIPAS
ncbi:MAG: CHRD domain-containing protein [Phycisphaerae bacterium]